MFLKTYVEGESALHCKKTPKYFFPSLALQVTKILQGRVKTSIDSLSKLSCEPGCIFLTPEKVCLILPSPETNSLEWLLFSSFFKGDDSAIKILCYTEANLKRETNLFPQSP